MDRLVASLLALSLLSMQGSLVRCPMAGSGDAHEGHGRAPAALPVHGHGTAAPAHPGPATSAHDPAGSPAPEGHGGGGDHAPPSGPTAPVAPGGCGALMACGLAALAAAPRPTRDLPGVVHAPRPLPGTLDSAPAAPVEPPPPRA